MNFTTSAYNMSRNIQRLLFQVMIHQNQKSLSNCACAVSYSRWTHRNPLKIVLPFEPTSKVSLKKEKVIELNPLVAKKSNVKVENAVQLNDETSDSDEEQRPFAPTKENLKNIKNKREEKLKKQKFYLSQKKVFDDNGEIIYEKLNENDGRTGALMVKLKSRKERMRSGHTLVEGWRLIVDGLEAKCQLKYIFFSRTEELDKVRAFLPKTGVLIYKIPYKEIELFSDVETPSGIFGVFEIPTNEHMKKLTNPLPLHLICDNIRMPGILGAILRAAVGAGCGKVLLSKGCVDVWDPKVIRSAAGAHFRLPIHHSVEWPDMQNFLDPNTSIFIADSNARVDDVEGEDIMENMQIPVIPYYAVEFGTLKHITLVIGGETEGISNESYALAASKKGIRLNIPLQKGVDSLNTGMATAVIALEIRKQFIQTWRKIKEGQVWSEAT